MGEGENWGCVGTQLRPSTCSSRDRGGWASGQAFHLCWGERPFKSCAWDPILQVQPLPPPPLGIRNFQSSKLIPGPRSPTVRCERPLSAVFSWGFGLTACYVQCHSPSWQMQCLNVQSTVALLSQVACFKKWRRWTEEAEAVIPVNPELKFLLGRGLCCSPSLVLLLCPLSLLLLPLKQVSPLQMPLVQLLLIGSEVLCFTGGELFFDELGGQSQKASCLNLAQSLKLRL